MSGTLHTITPSGGAVHRYEGKGPPPIEQLQELVGGYVQRLKARFEGRVRDMYVDEDGLQKGLPQNPGATALLAQPYLIHHEHLVGPAVIWVPDSKEQQT